MPVELKRVKEVFLAALERPDPAAREAYLQEACAGDEELRLQAEALLRQHEQASGFLEAPPPGLPLTADEAGAAGGASPGPAEAVGSRLGPYKLLQKLGEGGMGAVYLAEQEEPVKRRVALKVIKAGMDSAHVIARFEQERQALALMDHPNIAKVLDAGATPTGRPYFVMELVKGVPITTYCDQEHLPPKERLELFIPVCQAVQHAHQKGVIHRDLKPSNVLVALYDGKPIPKVIDFGVAKATAQKLTERTMFTEVGQIVGTLEYMAPEQAELNNLDIDTRADIYSLGVLLYELLTGSPPFTAKQLRSAAFTEMLRIIREVEPPRPSTKLSSSEELPSIAARRKLEPAKLTRLVHGDLDWIAMKCLAKERGRRYETANGLAMDVQRYLADEPVLAGPPSASYRLRKFARKYRTMLLTATAFALLLVAAALVSAWQAVRATQAAGAEKKANEQAQKRLEQLEKSNEIITSIFADLDILAVKQGAEPLEAVLAHRLVQAAAELEEEAVGDPLVVAGLQVRLAVTLLHLGHPQEAIPLLVRAQETQKARLGADHPDTLNSMANLALMYTEAGRLDLAVPLSEQSMGLLKARLGDDHPQTLWAMDNLAMAYTRAGKLDLAVPLWVETLRLAKARLGADHPRALRVMVGLAEAYREAGKPELALPLLEENLRLRKARLGGEHPGILVAMNNLALVYHDAGKPERALPLLEEVLRLKKARLGTTHPDRLQQMGNLATAYQEAGRLDLALPLLEETLKFRKAGLGADHPDTLVSMNGLAVAYHKAGKLGLALPLLEETLKLRGAKLGADHPDTLESRGNLATAYLDAGKPERALPLLEETLRLRKAKLGADHPATLTSMASLAMGYRGAGKPERALPLFEEALRLTRAKRGEDHPATVDCMNNLAVGYFEAGKLGPAVPLLEKAVKWRKARLGPDHPDTLNSTNNLAEAYKAVGKPDLALPLLEETAKHLKAKLGADHPLTLTVMTNLALQYLEVGKLDLALPLGEETLTLARAKLGADHPNTVFVMRSLATCYKRAGKMERALPLLEEAVRLTKAKLGADHPDTLASMNHLAGGYMDAGKLDLALPLYEETLKLTKAKLGPDHPDTLRSVNNLATGYREAGKLGLALPLFQEAAAGAEKSRFQNQYASERFVNNLIDCHERLRQFDQAEVWRRKWLAAVKGQSGAESPAYAGELAALGLNLLRQKKWADAESAIRDCLAIRRKKEPDAWTTFNTQSMLGGALLGQKKYADAEPLLLKGYEGMKQRKATVPAAGKVRLTEALDRLVQLYDEWGKPHEAAKWRKEREAAKKAENKD